jgi:phytoene synthase
VARIKLAWWRTEVAAMYKGTPTHPVTQALQPHLAAYNLLEQQHLQAIIDGMEMDLTRRATWTIPALRKYCWHVAGVVGILSASIFGATPADPAIRGEAGPGLPAHEHHPRRRRRCAQGPHLPAGQRAAAVQRDRGRHPERRHSEKFEALMKFQADRAQKASTTKRSPCCRRKTGAPSAPA